MSAFLIDSRFLLSNTTETFWGAPLIVADGKDNTFCYGFLRDLLRLRNSLCISAGMIVFGSDASSLATENDIRSVVDLCRELGILVIEEPKLPVLAIVATQQYRSHFEGQVPEGVSPCRRCKSARVAARVRRTRRPAPILRWFLEFEHGEAEHGTGTCLSMVTAVLSV